jgi:REP element-mobilizing transposase RayT
MQYGSKQHRRRSIRLSGYDYSQNGAYFITLCAYNRECLFGEIINDEMHLNNAGKMMRDEWLEISNKFPTIELDEFVIMPNHMHGIIQIVDDMYIKNNDADVGATLVVARNETNRAGTMENRAGTRPAPTVGNIVGAFKSLTTNEYIRRVKSGEIPSFETYIWQRNYYEHIIRDEKALANIREYIEGNPKNWQDDENFRIA